MAGRHFTGLNRFFRPAAFGQQAAYAQPDEAYSIIVGIRMIEIPFSFYLNDEPHISTPKYNMFYIHPTMTFVNLEARLRVWIPRVPSMQPSTFKIYLARLRSSTSVTPNAHSTFTPLEYDHICQIDAAANWEPVLDFLSVEGRDMFILSVLVQSRTSETWTRQGSNVAMACQMGQPIRSQVLAAVPARNATMPAAPSMPAAPATATASTIPQAPSAPPVPTTVPAPPPQRPASSTAGTLNPLSYRRVRLQNQMSNKAAVDRHAEENVALEDVVVSTDEDQDGDNGVSLGDYNSPVAGSSKRTPKREVAGGSATRGRLHSPSPDQER